MNDEVWLVVITGFGQMHDVTNPPVVPLDA
jgi:hypothetical protein